MSGETSSTLMFTTTADDDGDLFSVAVSNGEGSVTSGSAELLVDFGMAGPSQTNRLIEITSPWRYEVSGTDLGTSWRNAVYPDSSWAVGGGLLYVESSALPAAKTTALPLTGGSIPTTCYFRTEFTNSLPSNPYSMSLVANTVTDDGVVVYLNGTEVLRNHMDAGTVSFTTFGTTVGNATMEGPFLLDTASLISGSNIVAAEVHQSTAGSSDIVMGLTLDLIWSERVQDTVAPVVAGTTPMPGSSVTNLTQIEIAFSEVVQGVDAADLLINGTAASSVSAVSSSEYVFQFAEPAEGIVSVSWAGDHGITDASPYEYPFAGAGFSYLFSSSPSDDTKLEFTKVFQSSDFNPSTKAVDAIDGSIATHSLTEDIPGSYWQAELGRPFELTRIELINRATPDDAEMDGLTLSLFNMDDQIVYETILSNPGSSGIVLVEVPAGTSARTLRIGLSGSDTNGAGNHRVGISEVRLFGPPNIPFSPEPFIPDETEVPDVVVSQSTTLSDSYPAEKAIDNNTGSFSHTDNASPNNYWICDLGTSRPITSVELVNRSGSSTTPRMGNLTLRILDAASNSMASATTTNPGDGGTYTFTPPANTSGRYVKVGLENGALNGHGDYVVCLAEVAVFDGSIDWLGAGAQSTLPEPTENLATSKRSFMLRISDADAPSGNANDGDYATETRTTSNAFDGYWEVDLGATYALYGIRAIAPNDLAERLGYTIARLYDEEHKSVHSQKVTGSSYLCDIDLNGPVFARYVRIGLENKTTPNDTGTVNEYEIGFNEVEVFGRAVSEVGILSFNTSDTSVSSGQSVTLDWSVEDVKRAEIFPDIGSVGANTDTNGAGSIIQTMTTSTEFILIATNKAGIFAEAVGVEVDGIPLSVRISEIVAENKYSLKDGYDDAPDWIELRNTGNSTVDLTGWGLTDNPSNPMKFVFPSTTLAPHETLIVFASNNDTPVDPAGLLHADFALGKNGETLQLTAANGSTVIDSVSYPALDTDLSYGRDLAGIWTFMEPTPDAVNSGGTYEGWLEPLDWSHARGYCKTNFTLTVTSENPGATILYSLDGSKPSIPYTTGLPITGTSAVRIQPVQAGYKSPVIQTKTFVFLDDVIAASNMDTGITQDPDYAARMKPGLLDLPAISIVVPTAPEYSEQACSMEILWGDGQNPIQENCGVSLYGGAVQTFDKESFQLAFRSEYGNGKLDAPLFNGFDHGVLAKTSFDKLQLHAGNQDRTTGFYMSDRFVQDSMLEMGSLNPHGRYVHVYLNGEYWGQYNCKEMLNDSFLATYLGGEDEDYVDVKGNNNDRTGISWAIGVGDPPNPEPWERVRALRDDFVAVSPYLDVSHYIDFMLLWGYGYAEQEFKASGPKDAGSGYKFWMNDSDRFLRDGSGDRLENTVGPGYIWSSLLSEAHPDFMMLLADRMYRNYFNNGAMTQAACDARLVARMDEIRDSFLAEAARWGYVTPESWETKGETIRSDMFPYRAGELIAQWRSFGWFPSFDPPTFNQYGGSVLDGFQPILTSTDGTIYYTLDGTDPRLPGGAISQSALIWSAGAVTVTEDITITTRVRTPDGEWSALAGPLFLLGSRQVPAAGELLISEVNYNPDGPDEYEFIELWNRGTNLLDLSGVNISNAVRYIFPENTTLNPNAHIVVVEDAAAFADRYQNILSPWYWDGIEVAGEWVGGLSDGGEQIALLSADETLISSVHYLTDGDWPERPDGGGSSLELSNPASIPSDSAEQAAYLNEGRNWTASSLYHGSPGRFDSESINVVINEVLAHTDVGVDWIEFYNAGSSSADLSTMAITDSLDLPTRYLIPGGTSIDSDGYLTVSASNLGFGFSELGSSAYLLELAGTNIIRMVDSVSFPAVEREEPFGRYLRSDGIVDFTELLTITPGAANALPRVGPVVISEIMFVPEIGRSEYIEFMNISDAAVPLYDPAISSNVWNVADVGNFAFPEGTVLAPDEVAILCATNPATFRSQYGVDASVQIFGPWTGGLAAEGEKLQLLNPGDPEFDGFVPMYRMDHVSYRTNAFWSVANSGDVSLERIPLDAYGNDPASWRASPRKGTAGFVIGEVFDMGTALSASPGQMPILSFEALVGESYRVLYTDSLVDPDWQLLIDLPDVDADWVEIIDPELEVPGRFYQIIWDR
ncbi:lamin tail domain-containing protein [Pontiellaceae bacterium B1224]|nr:lamin tail domain-containing protein [Pontiellaceae bacterium B1224]